ncbi:unnamed protein product [Calypogeia fissa]
MEVLTFAGAICITIMIAVFWRCQEIRETNSFQSLTSQFSFLPACTLRIRGTDFNIISSHSPSILSG